MDNATLTQFIELFAGVRIGVLGDLMVDRFIYGDALRISPEAPVPVVNIRKRTTQPGGAANVANNVISLGGRASLFGVLGDDPPGHEIRHLLIAEGCDVQGIVAPPSYESTVKTRVVAQSQQLLRIDEEHASPIDADSEALLLARIVEQLPELAVFVISDYAKGAVTADLAARVIELCRSRQIPVVVDPKPANMANYSGASVLKPNLGEALRYVGREGARWDEMEAVCRAIRERAAVEAVIVTAGSHGMYVLEAAGFTHIEGQARDVFDVAGAGDSTLAAVALGLGAGASLVDAARLGNLAGSLAVGKLGVAAVGGGELRHEIEAGHEA